MGLLTGFSIISGVEVVYFIFKCVGNVITKHHANTLNVQ